MACSPPASAAGEEPEREARAAAAVRGVQYLSQSKNHIKQHFPKVSILDFDNLLHYKRLYS